MSVLCFGWVDWGLEFPIGLSPVVRFREPFWVQGVRGISGFESCWPTPEGVSGLGFRFRVFANIETFSFIFGS